MALSYVGGTASVNDWATLPTFTAGDIALVYAYLDGSNSPPTLPSGWTNIASSGANSNSSRVGYRVLQTGDTTTGNWLNATEVQAHVLRGQHPTTPIGNNAAGGANNSNQLSYTGFTLSNTSGTSWVVGMAGHRTATDVNAKAVTGMTTRSGSVTWFGAHTAEAVSTFATSDYTTTVNASSGWRSYAVEVIASTPTSTGTAQLSLAVGQVPATRTGHEIVLRARKTGGTTSDVIYAQLYEGATGIGSALATSALSTSFTEYTLAIPDADAEDIGSYSNLELRLYGYSGSGSATTFEISEARLLLPAPASGTHYGASSSSFSVGITTSGSVETAGAAQTGTARLSLAGGFTPTVRTDHEISLRARKTAPGDAATIRARLYEGAVPIADLESGTLGTAYAVYALAVPEAGAATIMSYADLELRLWGYSAAGSAAVFEVSEASLVIPGSSTSGSVSAQASLSSITSISVGLGDVIYPGTAVYPHSFVSVTATTAASATVSATTTYGQSIVPLSAGFYTYGYIPPDRDGGAVLASTATVTADSLHTTLAAATISATSEVLVAAIGGVDHSDAAALTATATVAAAGTITSPPAPPVYIPYFETMPDLLAGVAFSDAPQDPYPTWTDIAAYVRSLSTQRGRQFELDRVETGQLSATLSNLDGRFSPENTGGPYYGDLIPTRRMRIGLQWTSPTENLVADGSFESGRQIPNTYTMGAPWTCYQGSVHVNTGGVHPASGGYHCYSDNITSSVAIESDFIPVDIAQPYTLSHYVQQWQQLGIVDPNGTIRLICYDANLAYLGFVYPNEASAGTSYDSGHAITYTGSFVRWGGTYDGASGVSGSNVGGFMAGTEWVRVEVVPQYTATSFAQGIGVVIDAVQLVQDTVAHAWDDTKTYVQGGWTQADVFNGYLEGYPQEFPAFGSDSVVRQRAVDAFLPLSMTKLVPATTTLYLSINATDLNVPVANQSLPMPQAFPFTIRIDAEEMTVTSGVPGSYVVERAQNGTEAAAHASGAVVHPDAVSFGEAYSDQRIRQVLEFIGLGASEYNLEAGQTLLAASENLAGQSPLEHLNLVAEVEGGRLFAAADGRLTFHSRHHLFQSEVASRATFGDAGLNTGELPYQDIRITHEQERIYNIVRITAADGTVHEVRDEDSIADHYERVLEKQWPLADANEALAAAQYLLRRYSRMQVRIPELTVTGQKDPDTLWPYLLALEIGQRYRVLRRPSITSSHIEDATIDKELIVEGIEHTLEPGRAQTRIQLSLADTTHYWRLGVAGYSELGTTTRLVY